LFYLISEELAGGRYSGHRFKGIGKMKTSKADLVKDGARNIHGKFAILWIFFLTYVSLFLQFFSLLGFNHF